MTFLCVCYMYYQTVVPATSSYMHEASTKYFSSRKPSLLLLQRGVQGKGTYRALPVLSGEACLLSRVSSFSGLTIDVGMCRARGSLKLVKYLCFYESGMGNVAENPVSSPALPPCYREKQGCCCQEVLWSSSTPGQCSL